MSNVNLQNLLFKVNLLDKLSGPGKTMMTNMDLVSSRIQTGFQKIGTGIAGAVGAGYSLNKIIAPAKEMRTAMGEVRSLGVADDVLNNLSNNALKYSIRYGESASEFVGASYDIQSAIAGLKGNELSEFTNASAVLAKGTKADTATITSYVGTMYGIFQKNAEAMGKSEWVNMLAGQTAMAVQMFKTTGTEMSGAFGNLGAEATTHGIAMNEQIAILGTLQATMTGTEAGTKYKSFLAGVGKAQKALGLEFTDSNGKMLPMVTILDRIKGRFGEIDTVAESDMLQKAFGRKEAVGLIKLLSTNVDGLSQSIASVGEQKGIDKAMEMASTITDSWDRPGKVVEAVFIKFGGTMLKVLQPVYLWIEKTGQSMITWMDKFPNLTKWLGIGVMGILGLVATFSLLSVVAGISSFVMAGWGLTMAIITSPITLVVLGIAALIGVVAAAIFYWEEWTGAIVGWVSAFGETSGIFAFVDDVLLYFEKIPAWFSVFKNWLGGLDLFSFVGDSLNWLLEKVNMIPGIDIDLAEAPKPPKAPAAIAGGAGGDIPKGGLMSQISNVMSTNNKQDVGGITVNNFGQPMNGFQLADEIALASG